MRPAECAAACARLLEERRPGWRVLAVAGESGAGKTTLANALASELEAVVLHQDDYFFLPPAETRARRLEALSNVGLGEVDLARLAEDLAAFCGGATEVRPPLLNAPVPLPGHRLIVEGTYVLGLDRADARVFIDRTFQQTVADRARRGRDAMEPFVEEVLLIEQPLVRAQMTSADVVVDDTFCPRLG